MFVIDASTALATLLGQPEAMLSDPLIVRMAVEPALVPAHWGLEISNVLLRELRRGHLDEGQASALAQEAAAWPVSVDDQTAVLALSRVHDLARERGLTAYDAAYLELCLRRGASLATFDRQLASAADALGVALIVGKE
jgi:predicted nucleic acid-binding protein